MECNYVRSLADSYLSEQLLVETTHGIVQHLERCLACRADIEAKRRLREKLRTAFEGAADLQPRPEFLDGLPLRLLAGNPALQRRPKWQWWLALAASVFVAVIGASSVVWLAQTGLSELRHLAAGDHQNCALKFALPEPPITLTEASTKFDVAFRGLATVQLPARSSSGDAIDLVERHACVFEGQRFAHIVVRYKGTAVSLLVSDETGSRKGWWLNATPREMSPARGFNVASFRGSQHTVFAVSALSTEDLQELARTVAGPIAQALAG